MPRSIRPVLHSVIFNSSAIFVIQKSAKRSHLVGVSISKTHDIHHKDHLTQFEQLFYRVVMSLYYLQVLAASFITVWSMNSVFLSQPKRKWPDTVWIACWFLTNRINLIPVWSMHLQTETTAKCRTSLTLLQHKALVNSMPSQILL